MIEIERKFLVRNDSYKSTAFSATKIVQAYLCSKPEHVVRVRIKGEKGYLTIKGISSESGMSRFEWEKEIEIADAEKLTALCEKSIEKIRYEINFENSIYEVDEFLGDNLGLVIAEIELEQEDSIFKKPPWLGEEVTQDKKYYNSYLFENPYKNW